MTTLVKVIITAGGNSSRFGSNKLLEKIHGKEVIRWSVEAFAGYEVIVCANDEAVKEIFRPSRHSEARSAEESPAQNDVVVVAGGATRQESVFNGLKACAGATHVLIHDAARPVVSADLVRRAVDLTVEKGAMSAAVKTTDTIKEVENGVVVRTLKRAGLYNTQTPQGFEYNLIMRAHEKFAHGNFTDDASMVEAMGEKVYILESPPENIKITTPRDIDAARCYLSPTKFST